MFIDFLLERFKKNEDKDAVVWDWKSHSYADLIQNYENAFAYLETERIERFAVVSLEADFSPLSIAFLLALIDRGCIVVPLTSTVREKLPEFLEIAQVQYRLLIDASDHAETIRLGSVPTNELVRALQGKKHPGLILFSSGSAGKPKAALHDFLPLLEKFKIERNSKRMISFLLFDHIGGINTLFYCLSNAGTLITVPNRNVSTVLETVQNFKVQILPTSPTFLNLITVSQEWRKFDLSSLEIITYGTEPMQASTLENTVRIFPAATLQQTYGLSEIGIMRSKSESNHSLWVKIGGEGYETRVRDGLLEIKAKAAMLGYLNAPSPFTEDGWFMTGDTVEVRDDFFRILGRKSEIINVGGEKVYPAEIESELLRLENVREAIVVGEPHPLTGSLVKATVRLSNAEGLSGFRVRMTKTLRERGLPSFKIPQKVVLSDGELHSDRFKMMRKNN